MGEPRAGERIVDVRLDEHSLSAHLADGRVITVPLAWYPRLMDATAEQRENWQIAGGGFGIHWPERSTRISAQKVSCEVHRHRSAWSLELDLNLVRLPDQVQPNGGIAASRVAQDGGFHPPYESR